MSNSFSPRPFEYFPRFIKPQPYLSPCFSFSVVAARSEDGGFALGSRLPWPSIATDSAYYHSVTSLTRSDYERIEQGNSIIFTGAEKPANPDGKLNVIIFGRATWMAKQKRVASARISVVLTTNKEVQQEIFNRRINGGELVYAYSSLSDALEALKQEEINQKISSVFVIGGAKVIEDECYHHPQCQTIYLTQVHSAFQHDISLSEPPQALYQLIAKSEVINENDVKFSFQILIKRELSEITEQKEQNELELN
jgi:dihydrofolate reductase